MWLSERLPSVTTRVPIALLEGAVRPVLACEGHTGDDFRAFHRLSSARGRGCQRGEVVDLDPASRGRAWVQRDSSVPSMMC